VRNAIAVLSIVVVVLVVIACMGCGKKAPATQAPAEVGEAAPGPQTPTEVAAPAEEKPGEAEAEVKEEEGEAVPESAEESEEEKPSKAKLSDKEYMDMMIEIAQVAQKGAKKKISQAKMLEQVEAICKKYGLSVDELDEEASAHELSQAESLEFLQKMSDALKEVK